MYFCQFLMSTTQNNWDQLCQLIIYLQQGILIGSLVIGTQKCYVVYQLLMLWGIVLGTQACSDFYC